MSCSSAPATATSRSMPGERRADRADRLRDRQRVLEQAVAVGLVKALGGGRRAVARPGRRVAAPKTASSSRRRSRSWIVADELAQVGLHQRGRARRAVAQRGLVEGPGGRGAQRAQRELGAVAVVAACSRPLTWTRRADGRDRGVAPRRRRRTCDGSAAGAVAEQQAQVAAAARASRTARPRERAARRRRLRPSCRSFTNMDDTVASGRGRTAARSVASMATQRRSSPAAPAASARPSRAPSSTAAGASSCRSTTRPSASASRRTSGSCSSRPTSSTPDSAARGHGARRRRRERAAARGRQPRRRLRDGRARPRDADRGLRGASCG